MLDLCTIRNLKDYISRYQSILITRIMAEASACSSGLKITVVPKELMYEQLWHYISSMYE